MGRLAAQVGHVVVLWEAAASGLTWNICLTFCLGKLTLSLWSSW